MWSIDSFWDQDCIWKVAVLQITVVQSAVVVLAFLEICQIIWTSWSYDVISHNYSAFCNGSMLLKPLQIRQINVFPMVNEYHIKRTMIFKEILMSLNRSQMKFNQIWKSSMLMKFAGYWRVLFTRIESMNSSFGSIGHDQRRISNISSQLKDSLRLVLLNCINNNFTFITA